MPFFQRRQRQHTVPGLDDTPPPSPARPDGAAVARERLEQVGGGLGGCATPRAAAVGEEEETSPSVTGSESSEGVDASTRPLAPGATDEGGSSSRTGALLSTPTSMAPLSVDGSTAAAGAAASEGAGEKNRGGGNTRRQQQQPGSAALAVVGVGAGTPGGYWSRRPSTAGAGNAVVAADNTNNGRRSSGGRPSSSSHRRHHSHDSDAEIGHRFSWREFGYMCGPGLLMAVAYLDPGNLEADIQAGAHVGYSLLWFVALAFGCGFAFQCMTARLGIVTGRDLAAVAGKEFGEEKERERERESRERERERE